MGPSSTTLPNRVFASGDLKGIHLDPDLQDLLLTAHVLVPFPVSPAVSYGPEVSGSISGRAHLLPQFLVCSIPLYSLLPQPAPQPIGVVVPTAAPVILGYVGEGAQSHEMAELSM